MSRTLTKAGRYQIVGELGRGSMGVVYKGFDPIIGRTVAIKTMLTEALPAAEFEEYKARFQREAQAAGILTHPNIVTVYDFGEDNGVLFLAMEFLEGESLQHLVEKQGVLPVETVLPMYEQVCSALDAAHSHKIVHRDVKPANIMILESGLVKMTDFGIAKVMHTGMTQAGQILGTPNYMSPEQVKGRSVDGRSDIFSLGVILYELITGEKPFGGQNITTVIYKIINENPIPPRELDPTLHLGLSYVIQKALAKNPDERYQTCKELADDLKNYRALGDSQAPSETVAIRVPPIHGMAAETVVSPSIFASPAGPVPPPRPPARPASAPPKFQVPPPPRIERQKFEPSFVPPPPLPAGPASRPTQIAVPRATPRVELAPGAEVTPPAPVASPVAPPAQQIERPRPASPVAPPIISTPEPRKSSGAVWAIVVLIIAGGLAGGGYYLYKLKRTAQVVLNPTTGGTGGTAAANTTTGSGATSATSPATGTTTAPAGTAVSATTTDTGTSQPGATTATTGQPGATTTTSNPAGTTTNPTTEPSRRTEVTEPAVNSSASLEVRSDPSGASITLDDVPNPGWVTPHTISDIPLGPHRLSVSLDGYKSVTRVVKVQAAHMKPLNFNLEPAKTAVTTPPQPKPEVGTPAGTGSYAIDTNPRGATISIDGKEAGQSPFTASLTEGSHVIRAELSGYRTHEKTVKVDDGSIGTVRLDLEVSAQNDSGIVEITTNPPGASIFVDAIGRGQTPNNVKLGAGPHHLTLRLQGYQPIDEDISVSRNQTIPFDKTLSPR
jgi:eukaryotic-like serine/threonine-protein kinase